MEKVDSVAHTADTGGRRRYTRRPAADPPWTDDDAVNSQQWHRGMTLIATISLFIGTRSAWTQAMLSHPPAAGVISLCYAGILVCGVLALVVRGRRALVRVDITVLVLAVALVVCGYWLNHIGTDEGVLTGQAANQIAHGRPVYGQPWPWLFGTSNSGLTKTMSGSYDYTYGYPPLTALLAAPVHAFLPSSAAATLVTTGALIAGTVTLWLMLPAPWRSAATAVCLGFGVLPGYARSGYPAIVALALLIPVAVRWPATGAGGRLGRCGILRAVCLGAACAAQQLAWFFAPFLLIGLYAVRRGELGARPAAAVLARFAGVSAVTWVGINAYFAAQGFSAWWHGLLLPLTQKAILHGQGLMGISYYFTDGSSRLDYYSYASQLFLVGLLAATLLFVRRLGTALTVLPWLPFYLAIRSQDGYFLMMTPLWLAAAATVPALSLASAWQPRIPRFTGRGAKAALCAALVTPAALCAGIAASSPPPLRMTLTTRISDQPHPAVTAVTVKAVNTTSTALTPHFASRIGQGASNWWTVTSGPATLSPHSAAVYVVRPAGGHRPVPGAHQRMYLVAVTGSPMTISTARVEVTMRPPSR
ncbi:hypothetical protein [Streptomyces reticuliscabiei]|uniref:hypothetical protein n=1 Tax=Streptomyces reticuliscabiei TaxID=146821 RepID=UPI000A3B542F|nr:hypothetical protein [Streptomyces reticuliscabiei]